MEEHNNIIVLHLIHAAAIENECAATASAQVSAARGSHQGGSLRSAQPQVQAAFPLHEELKVNRGSTSVLKKTLFRGIPLLLLLYFIRYLWYTSAMGWKSLKMKNSI